MSMSIGVYALAPGTIQQSMSLDVIANNLANAGSPGYKKDGVLFDDFMNQHTYTDMQQGTISQTGNPLDIALVGKGFLQVKSDQGIVYTRAGNLTLDNQHTLVTQSGWPVLGVDGQPIRLTDGKAIHIDSSGRVFDGDSKKGKIAVIQFKDESQLRKIGDTCFEAQPGQAQLLTSKPYTIEQGALEQPNLNIVKQMVDLIEASRTVGSYQKVLQTFSHQDSEITKAAGNL